MEIRRDIEKQQRLFSRMLIFVGILVILDILTTYIALQWDIDTEGWPPMVFLMEKFGFWGSQAIKIVLSGYSLWGVNKWIHVGAFVKPVLYFSIVIPILVIAVGGAIIVIFLWFLAYPIAQF